MLISGDCGRRTACACIEPAMRSKITRWLLAFTLSISLLLVSCGGVSGSSSEGWQYTALGDSLAVGVLDTQGGYVVRYRSFLQSDANREVMLTNLGQNGWQSSDLLNAVRNDTTFRNALSSADVVTFDIGGNDLLHALNLFRQGACGGADNQDCMRSAVANFIPNWDATVQEILTLRDKNRTIIRTMNVYNPFVGELMVTGTFPIVKGYLDQVDAHIASSAAANGIPMVRVYEAFNGPNGDEDPVMKGYISVDGIHPNDAGHKVIADLFRGLGYAPLK